MSERTDELQQWIESLLNFDFKVGFWEELKTGLILCEVLNKIRANSCKYLEAPYGYIHKRNIESYLLGCRSLGMPKDTLFKSKHLLNVPLSDTHEIISNLYSLNEIAKTEIDTFNGPYILTQSSKSKLQSLLTPLSTTELRQFQTAQSLQTLIAYLVNQVAFCNYRDSAYWKEFTRTLCSHLRDITDFEMLQKVLNSAYSVSNAASDRRNNNERVCLLRVLCVHLYSNSKIEGSVDDYDDIYYDCTDTNDSDDSADVLFNGFESSHAIWSLIELCIENGANPVCIGPTNSDNLRNIQPCYDGLNILYRKQSILFSEFQRRFLLIMRSCVTSSSFLPALVTYCVHSDRYFYLGCAIDTATNRMIYPEIAMALLVSGYDLYHECECNNLESKHDYSFSCVSSTYHLFSSSLNRITKQQYFLDFLFYLNIANQSSILEYFDCNKWKYRVLKRLPLLSKEWLTFAANMVLPVVSLEMEWANEMDEYLIVWNAFINASLQTSLCISVLPFCGLIFGVTMKKLIRFYAHSDIDCLKSIVACNYQFSATWNGSLLFELLSDKKVESGNMAYLLEHIHGIYSEMYSRTGYYRTTEIYDLVNLFDWNVIHQNMCVVFSFEYFEYAICAHFHILCHKSKEQQLSFFLKNKILKFKFCTEIHGLISTRFHYLIAQFEYLNMYSVGRVFHWFIREYSKCNNVRAKQIARNELLILIRDPEMEKLCKKNQIIQTHFKNLNQLTM